MTFITYQATRNLTHTTTQCAIDDDLDEYEERTHAHTRTHTHTHTPTNSESGEQTKAAFHLTKGGSAHIDGKLAQTWISLAQWTLRSQNVQQVVTGCSQEDVGALGQLGRPRPQQIVHVTHELEFIVTTKPCTHRLRVRTLVLL
jgi:hypothetical protein